MHGATLGSGHRARGVLTGDDRGRARHADRPARDRPGSRAGCRRDGQPAAAHRSPAHGLVGLLGLRDRRRDGARTGAWSTSSAPDSAARVPPDRHGGFASWPADPARLSTRMGAGTTASFTLVPAEQEDRGRSCGTCVPSAPGIGPGNLGSGHDLHVAAHPPARPYQRARPRAPPRRTTRSPRSRRSSPGCGASRCRCRTTPCATCWCTSSRRTAGPYLIDAGWNTDDAFGALQAGMKRGGLRDRRRPGRHGDAHPPRPLRAGRAHPRGLGGLDLAAPGRRRAHPRPLRRARRPARPGGRRAAAHGRAGRGARAAAERGHAGAVAGRPRLPRRPARGRREARGARLGPDRHLDARGTRPATCASTRRRASSCSRATTCCRASRPTSRSTPRPGRTRSGDYLASLDKLEPYEVDEVLPAHEYRFADLHGPARGAAPAPPGPLRRGGRHSARGPAQRLGRRAAHEVVAPWDDIAGFMRRAAVGEAVSHLRALEIDGVVQVEDGEPALWSLTEQARPDGAPALLASVRA